MAVRPTTAISITATLQVIIMTTTTITGGAGTWCCLRITERTKAAQVVGWTAGM